MNKLGVEARGPLLDRDYEGVIFFFDGDVSVVLVVEFVHELPCHVGTGAF